MIRQVYGSRPGFRTATIKGTARCLAPLSEFDQIKIAAEYIQRKIGDRKIEVIVTLGSGLGDLAGQIENPITIPYSEIPCFRSATFIKTLLTRIPTFPFSNIVSHMSQSCKRFIDSSKPGKSFALIKELV